MKKILILVIILIAGLMTWYFWRQKEGKYTGPLKEITLGVDFSDILSAPAIIAENQGYFLDEGLDVKIIEYPSGRTALADMVKHKNMDIVTAAQTPVMYNSFGGDGYSIIAGMSYSYDAGALVLARRDRGIRIAADLKGKRIGTPLGSSGQFFLSLFLIRNGLKISDIEVIDIDAPNLPQALEDGQVDAISIWQPQIYNAQKLLGEKSVLLPSENIYRIDFYLISNNDFLEKNVDASGRLLKAIDRAENFILKNREKSIDIVSGRMGIDKEIATAIWDGYQFKLFLDQPILTDLEEEARWAIKEGLVSQEVSPNYLNYIYSEVLAEVKPEAVTIIK